MKNKIIFFLIISLICINNLQITTLAAQKTLLIQEQTKDQKDLLAEITDLENQIREKNEEIEIVKHTKISTQFQDEKISKINKELKYLQKALDKKKKKYSDKCFHKIFLEKLRIKF